MIVIYITLLQNVLLSNEFVISATLIFPFFRVFSRIFADKLKLLVNFASVNFFFDLLTIQKKIPTLVFENRWAS